MADDRIIGLIEKHLRGELSAQEREELENWQARSPENEAAVNLLSDPETRRQELAIGNKGKYPRMEDNPRMMEVLNREGNPKISEAMEQSGQLAEGKPIRRLRITRMLAAASIAAVAVIGTFYFIHKSTGSQPERTAATQRPKAYDLEPGGDRAVLRLGNGSVIQLSDANIGTLAEQGSARVIKPGNGKLSYTVNGNKVHHAAVVYNTIYTPRGGQYQVTLPDGSNVWLNAQSSLRYPTAFTGPDRTVELTGEAFFDVAKRPSQPFRVIINPGPDGKGQTRVEVLGTSFNVMAYDDEPGVRTSLLEGSVRVSRASVQSVVSSSVVLKPGEQAFSPNGDEAADGIRLIPDADMGQAIAWKNGKFQFSDVNIHEIMKTLGRWYDLGEIKYEGDVSKLNLTGIISRKANVSQLFQLFEASGIVAFKIDSLHNVTVIHK